MAGVGLVLDTRQKDAKAAVREIEREMAEIGHSVGKTDRAGGQVTRPGANVETEDGCEENRTSLR